MNNRIEWIDTLKGLGIILVVWGHLNLPIEAETIIYSFHMPLFFFISGYLFKGSNRSFGELIKRKTRSLLIPYLFFATISIPFGLLIDLLLGDGIKPLNTIMNFFFLNGSVGWNSPIWFLIVLFLVEVLFFIFYKSKFQMGIVVAVFFVLGYFMAQTHYEFPFGLHIVSWSIIFYAIGYFIRQKSIVDKLTSSYFAIGISIVCLITLNVVFGLILNERVSVYHNQVGNYFYFYISALSGILLTCVVISKLPTSKLLKFYGENTLLILAVHYFIIYAYRAVDEIVFGSTILLNDSYVTSIILAVLALTICAPLSYIFNRYLPFAVGRKPIVKNKKIDNKVVV